ncbi:MAG: hypothetical protein ACKOFI_08465, partial [Phycisphaerales bacterium]
RDFLGIGARTARIGAPERMHPKRPVEGLACARSEVSGARVWGWARAPIPRKSRTAATSPNGTPVCAMPNGPGFMPTKRMAGRGRAMRR